MTRLARSQVTNRRGLALRVAFCHSCNPSHGSFLVSLTRSPSPRSPSVNLHVPPPFSTPARPQTRLFLSVINQCGAAICERAADGLPFPKRRGKCCFFERNPITHNYALETVGRVSWLCVHALAEVVCFFRSKGGMISSFYSSAKILKRRRSRVALKSSLQFCIISYINTQIYILNFCNYKA